MLFSCWLSGGNPTLFMDFRKVWEPWEIQGLANKLGMPFGPGDLWAQKGIVDGDNSGSASFDWAGRPGDSIEAIMSRISLPGSVLYYFPGGGNSVTFFSPGGIDCLAGRLDLQRPLRHVQHGVGRSDDGRSAGEAGRTRWRILRRRRGRIHGSCPSTPRWASTSSTPRRTIFMPSGASKPCRLQYWMDMANVLSVAPWAKRPQWIEGTDRPQPLLFLLNGGENHAKILRARSSAVRPSPCLLPKGGGSLADNVRNLRVLCKLSYRYVFAKQSPNAAGTPVFVAPTPSLCTAR